MEPRELMDRVVAGSMRQHAAELTQRLLNGCEKCGAALVRDGQVIDPEATGVQVNRDGAYTILCRKCSHFDEAVEVGRKLPYGIALEDSKPIPGTDPGQFPTYDVQIGQYVVPVTGPELAESMREDIWQGGRTDPKADILAAQERVERNIGWNPGGLDGCTIDSISPDSGDVLIIGYPPSQTMAQREAIIAAINRLNIKRPVLVVPNEVNVESWALAELHAFRDEINAIIYDKERGK